MEENETLEVVTFGREITALLHIGLDMAMLRARGAYIRGAIEIEEFEAEVERLLRKREQLRRSGIRSAADRT
jgi:hypothetical protein